MLRRLIAAGLGAALAILPLMVVPSTALPEAAPAAQTLTWTASDRIDGYTSAPTQAVAGPTTVIFENSENTGNHTGMLHTLTFDTSTPGYNHDVDLNIAANPFDASNGRHEAQITLTPGRYRYFCAVPGHQMVGELVVTPGGVDTTPPVTSASVSGDRDGSGNYLGSATVTVTAADAESGVSTIEYEVDDTGFQRYSAPVVVTRLGDHSVQYRATDVAGNTSEIKSVQFRVVEAGPTDTTPPVTSAVVSGDRDGSGNYLGAATVTLSATDTESGVDRIEYSLDGAAFVRYTVPVVVNTVGSHMLHYRATDVAGNTAPEKMESFTVVVRPDTTPPVASAVVSGDRDGSGNYLGAATVTLSATDTESGVDRIEYSLDGAAFVRYTVPVVVNTVGSHMLHYRATDVAGNTAPEKMESFTVVVRPDTTPPVASAVVSGDRDGSGNYLGAATVTLSATDTESGVDRIEYSLDGAAFVRYTAPVVVNSIGAHTVRYRATDRAGNSSAEQQTTFTVVARPDITPPTVTTQVSGDRDGSGNYLGAATVTLSATDAESGVDRIEYSLDGAAFVRYSMPVVVTALGAHAIRYRAADVAGNVSAEQETTFTVVASPDTTAPVASAVVSGDRDGSGNYLGSATVTLSATDAESGVDRIEYSLDGTAFVRYSAPVTVNALGVHTVRYRAADRAGNVSTEQQTTFTVVARPDTTAPVTSAVVSGNRDGDGNYLGSATVTITATDSESGVDRIEYSLDGAAFARYSVPVVVSQAGAHTVHYRAADRAGNTSPEQLTSFTVVAGGPDACPESDTRATVVIGGQDSGVANVDIGNGCTISDLVDEHGEYADHAGFVRHVDRVTDALVAEGILTRRDKGSIVLAAARSDIGN